MSNLINVSKDELLWRIPESICSHFSVQLVFIQTNMNSMALLCLSTLVYIRSSKAESSLQYQHHTFTVNFTLHS